MPLRVAKSFSVTQQVGQARRGTLTLPHGVVQTPVFMPIATAGVVKTLAASEVAGLGASIILGNTYHLLLRPGVATLQAMQGMGAMMGWSGPMLTDSGGYQVFSLGNLLKTDEDGVTFQSHLDGSAVRLTPESSLAVQAAIGSDIRMQFDDVPAGDAPLARVQEAMERSLRWAARSRAAFFSAVDDGGSRPLLFGIVQGGTDVGLRERSRTALLDLGFDGYALGGLSVGEAREDALAMVQRIAPTLPNHQPRYFMGGGMPEEIIAYVCAGVDMFDCVLPTRNARHGQLFVWRAEPATAVADALARAQSGAGLAEIADALYLRVHATNERFAHDDGPIDPWNDVPICHEVSRAYLRHLFRVGDALGLRIATLHNLRFYLRLMEELRAILGRV